MIRKNSGYWCYIDGYCHIFIKKNRVVIYNTFNGALLDIIADSKVLGVLKKMQSPQNAGVVWVGDKELSDEGFRNFINSIRENLMGDLLDTRWSDGKPAQLIPHVNIQGDTEILKKDKTRSLGEKALGFLTILTVYLNDQCQQDCILCQSAFKQTAWCHKKTWGKGVFDIEWMKRLFIEASSASLDELHFTGGNILLYPYWREIADFTKNLGARRTAYIHIRNLAAAGSLGMLENAVDQIKVLFSFPFPESDVSKVFRMTNDSGLRAIPVFLTASEEEYNQIQSYLAKFPLEEARFIPVLNGSNMDFFQNNFFLVPEDITAHKPDSDFIYANGKINRDNFGNLSVLTNGDVYANLNERRLGNLTDGNLRQMIAEELAYGRSWMKIRKNTAPCRSCVYQQLCPPISNYNRVSRRYDFCFMNPSTPPQVTSNTEKSQ